MYREPVGVVGVISPWDFSLHLTNRSVAPALATGNAVVVKPSSLTPVTGGTLFAKIYEEAGLPPGVLSVVAGAGDEIGEVFVTHTVPRMMTFTGSTEVGRRIAATAGQHVKRAVLELGGNAPFIVLDDADLDRRNRHRGVRQVLQLGADLHRHQPHDRRSARPRRVPRPVGQARGRAEMGRDPSAEGTAFGPIIDQRQFDRVRQFVDATIAAGARVVLDGPSQGLVMHPVILADVTNDMPAARNEIFGPVAVIIGVDGEDEAIRVANDTEYGLSSAVCTRSLERGVAVARRIAAGMTHINDSPMNDEANAPFGGAKQSGLGRFGGVWALQEFTATHWITVQEKPRRYPF